MFFFSFYMSVQNVFFKIEIKSKRFLFSIKWYAIGNVKVSDSDIFIQNKFDMKGGGSIPVCL